jgi:eukaryotic-like serine/threonine-protein kinase
MEAFVPNSGAPLQGLYLLDTTKGPKQSRNLPPVVKLAASGWDCDASTDGTKLFFSQGTVDASVSGNPTQGPSTITVQPATGGHQTTIYRSPTLDVTTVRAITSTTLLILIENRTGDTSQNGLWKLNTDGTGLTRLTTDADGSQGLNSFTRHVWSNISRNGKMYALQEANLTRQTSAILFGSLNGGTPTTFVSTSDGSQLALVGWTTM